MGSTPVTVGEVLKITMSVFFWDCNPETKEHLFWYCDRIFTLCSALTNWIGEVTRIEVEFCLESVLLGYTNRLPCKNAINCIILVVKFFISKCKWKSVTLILLVYKATSSFIIILKRLHVTFPTRKNSYVETTEKTIFFKK